MDLYCDKEYIKQLQTYLYFLSLNDPYFPKIAADGIYGAETGSAVSAYQRKNGLPVTGCTDMVTWERIRNDYISMMANCRPPLPLAVLPDCDVSIGPGEKSDTVSIIQAVLRCLDAEYGFGDEIKINGCYGTEDARAVKKLQIIHGLDATGVIDVMTWNCICRDYAAVNTTQHNGQQ